MVLRTSPFGTREGFTSAVRHVQPCRLHRRGPPDSRNRRGVAKPSTPGPGRFRGAAAHPVDGPAGEYGDHTGAPTTEGHYADHNADPDRPDRLRASDVPVSGARMGTVSHSRTGQVSADGDVLEDLRWRGLVAQSTDEHALAAALAASPVTLYCGFDPTAASLHFGNFVQLIVLRKLQRAGHRVICWSAATGLIGDPRPTAERVLKSREQTAEWVDRIAGAGRAVPRLRRREPGAAGQQSRLDCADLGPGRPARHRQALLGQHDDPEGRGRARLNSDEGISYTEFSYMMLQAQDFLHLNRTSAARCRPAVDQYGNIIAGIDLIHRVTGRSVHLLATPADHRLRGQKFGKSEGNAVWLTAEMTSPYAFYQYWINVEDASVVMLQGVHRPVPRGDRGAGHRDRRASAGPGGAAGAGRRRDEPGTRDRGHRGRDRRERSAFRPRRPRRH